MDEYIRYQLLGRQRIYKINEKEELAQTPPVPRRSMKCTNKAKALGYIMTAENDLTEATQDRIGKGKTVCNMIK